MNELFHRVAVKVARRVGSSIAFITALTLIIIWIIIGLSVGFSDTWLLIINTACSITTFLIVFLIQNTQNRESRAMQLKLNELLKAVGNARTDLVDLEELTDQELDMLQDDFRRLRQEFIDRHDKIIQHRLHEHRKTKK